MSYPETAGKTIEEIEGLFRPGAARPWNTKPGGSLLDQRLLEVQEAQKRGEMVGKERREEGSEKNAKDETIV